MPEEKKQAVKRGYLCAEMILFACVLLTQTADLRKAEDVLIWLCIGINAVYMTAVSVSGLVRLIMLLTWFADVLLCTAFVCLVPASPGIRTDTYPFFAVCHAARSISDRTDGRECPRRNFLCCAGTFLIFTAVGKCPGSRSDDGMQAVFSASP